MRDKVEAVLEQLRPMVRADGGDIELLDVSDAGIVLAHIQNHCADCTGPILSRRRGLERLIREEVPEVQKVIAL